MHISCHRVYEGAAMILSEEIEKMEFALTAKSLTVADLCRKASIAQTTWGRWKRGEVEPNFRTWNSVMDAFTDLMKAKNKDAA
jgi:predicted transcriptional regulator